MAITVIVRHGGGDTKLTFDGTQRVVIGRGAGSDVRLPDPSVSHRHASLRAQGTEFSVVDEGSTNGTYVGSVRIAPNTSRVVRSGDRVRLGRVCLELRLDHGPMTRDVAAATRDLALAMVSQAMAAIGTAPTLQVRVVEGPDQGTALALRNEDAVYSVGRAPGCDLVLSDADCSREHVHVVVRRGVVFVRDQGAKNGTFVGETRAPSDREMPWRSVSMVRLGRTVLELNDPLHRALAQIEDAADEPVVDDVSPPIQDAARTATSATPMVASGLVAGSVSPMQAPTPSTDPRPHRRTGWSVIDMLVMAAAVSVLALSLAGLVWLLRG